MLLILALTTAVGSLEYIYILIYRCTDIYVYIFFSSC